MLEKTKKLITPDIEKSYSNFYDFFSQPCPRNVPDSFSEYTKKKGDFIGCFILIIGIISFLAILASNLEFFEQNWAKGSYTINNKISYPPQIYFFIVIGTLSTASMIYSQYKSLKLFRQGTILTGKLTKSKLCNTRYDSYYKIKISINKIANKEFYAYVRPEIIEKLRSNEFDVLYNKSKEVLVLLNIIYKDTYND